MSRYKNHPAFEYQVNDKIAFYTGNDFQESAEEWIDDFMGPIEYNEEEGWARLPDGRYIIHDPPRVRFLPPWRHYYEQHLRPRILLWRLKRAIKNVRQRQVRFFHHH